MGGVRDDVPLTPYINRVIHGDCLEVMRGMPDGSVDAIVTDPPYGMNRFETDGKDYLEKISPALLDFNRVLCDGGSAFVFTSTGEVMRVGGQSQFVAEKQEQGCLL